MPIHIPGARSIPVGVRYSSLVAMMALLLGCSSLTDLGGKPTLPAGVQDPMTFKTPAGALGMYHTAVAEFRQAFPRVLVTSGLLTDELQDEHTGGSTVVALAGDAGSPWQIDVRKTPEGGEVTSGGGLASGSYGALQTVRTYAVQAIGALRKYDPAAPPALQGEVYALAGYAELFLADLFCSGVPLSTLEFEGDYVYRPGSTTREVYQHAVALFDSALVLAADSARILNLARVGKGRALLDLGDYAAAAASVTSVPDTFRYQFPVVLSGSNEAHGLDDVFPFTSYASVSDREGSNGLPYRSGGDPRTTAVTAGVNGNGVPQYFPAKYGPPTSSSATIIIASGTEARLIQAEAALRSGDVATWLTALNVLRTPGQVTTPADTIRDTLGVTDCGESWGLCGNGGGNDPSQGQPAGGFSVPSGYVLAGADTTYPAPAGIQDYCNANSWYTPCWAGDTMVVLLYVRPGSTNWGVGTGGVSGLTPLNDPGATLSSSASDSARVALTFQERAYWLFLTGSRQGDLRRLLRQYGQWFHRQDQVYPTGVYPGYTGRYGQDVTLSIPQDEHTNPYFTGCFNRGA